VLKIEVTMSDTNEIIAKQISSAARALSDDKIIALHEPSLGPEEKTELVKCLDSGFVSSVGEQVGQFEQALADYMGAKYVIATSTGTAALQTALATIGIQRNAEVLMPSFTFVATANAATYLGGIPHFVDITKETLGMCPNALESRLKHIGKIRAGVLINKETGNPIKAIVPVHTFGHSCAMEPLLRIAYDYNIPIIEDAAESLGTLYGKKHLGTFGTIGCVSFNGNKIITTGGGGAIITNNENIANQARHLATTAKLPHSWRYFHDQIGYNFRMPNINAALGIAQLAKIETLISNKRKLYGYYKQTLGKSEFFDLVEEPAGTRSNYWLQATIVSSIPDKPIDIELILNYINSSGVHCRPSWVPLHSLPMYKNNPKGPLTVTSHLSGSIINLPSSPHLKVPVSTHHIDN